MSGPQENLKLEFAPDVSQHISTVQEKVCFKCCEKKPISEFYRHSQMADGHLGKCKQCTKDDTVKNYAANKDYYKNYDRLRAMLPHRVEMRKRYAATPNGRKIIDECRNRYSESPEGKEKIRESRLKWVSNNAEKRAAHIKKGNAVRDGKILPVSVCSKCGVDGRIEAHHPDYTKPLDVVWLCRSCHLAEHGKQSYQF